MKWPHLYAQRRNPPQFRHIIRISPVFFLHVLLCQKLARVPLFFEVFHNISEIRLSCSINKGDFAHA